jgi:aromatic ring hydroxylase
MAESLPVQPARLVDHLGHHTMAELTRLITGGVPPAMPPAPVNQGQIGLIVDYLWTLVPEDQVEALRAMQLQMEEMGSGMGSMPGMQMDHSQGDMPGMQMDSMAPGQTDESGSATPER